MPLLAGEFNADLSILSLAVPAYFLPFATIQLFSGAVSDATSRRSVVVLGFLGYAVASVLCGLAPNVELYLGGRALQGVANAFMTPILMATVGDVVPAPGLGRAMGRFGAANTAGNFIAPTVAGLLALLSWRLSYLAIATIALALAIVYWHYYGANTIARRVSPRLASREDRSSGVPPNAALLDVTGEGSKAKTTRRFALGRNISALGDNVFEILRGRMLRFGLAATIGYVGVAGSQYLWPTFLADTWQVPPEQAGPIVSLFGLSGIVGAPLTGYLADRVSRLHVAMAATGLGAGLYLLLLATPAPLAFGLVLGGLGLSLAAFWTGINTLVVEAYAAQRGAATSIFGSFRFLATTVSPLLYTPLYLMGGRTAFLAAAVVCGVAAVLVASTWKESTSEIAPTGYTT